MNTSHVAPHLAHIAHSPRQHSVGSTTRPTPWSATLATHFWLVQVWPAPRQPRPHSFGGTYPRHHLQIYTGPATRKASSPKSTFSVLHLGVQCRHSGLEIRYRNQHVGAKPGACSYLRHVHRWHLSAVGFIAVLQLRERVGGLGNPTSSRRLRLCPYLVSNSLYCLNCCKRLLVGLVRCSEVLEGSRKLRTCGIWWGSVGGSSIRTACSV